MKNRLYDQSIAEAIDLYLKSHDWKYHFIEEIGVFNFNVNMSGKVKALHYDVIVGISGFTVTAWQYLGADPLDETEMNRMARFLTRANYGLRNGNFEMDMERGDIRYKVYCNCHDVSVTNGMLLDSIHLPHTMFDKYNPGIFGILFEGLSDKQAVMKCHDESNGMLAKLRELRKKLKEELESDTVEEAVPEEPKEGEPSPEVAEFLRMLEELADGPDDDDSDLDFELAEDEAPDPDTDENPNPDPVEEEEAPLPFIL